MPNLDLELKTGLSSFRKIAIGTWKTAYDPSVYGSMTLEMDEALKYLDEFRVKTGRKLTVTHMMAKAVAGVLEAAPDANAILRFNSIYLRKDIGVFFQVALEDDETGELDLSGATIHSANTKTLLEVVDEFQATVDRVRAKKDKELEGTRNTFKSIPFFLLNTFTWLLSLLIYGLNLDMRWAGVPKDAFGSCMVTNVGSLGLEEAWVPLVPYSRVPLLIATGTIRKQALVDEDGQVVVRKTMKCCATFDHRILDGTHAAIMSKVLHRWFHDPYTYFGEIPDLGGAEEAPASDAEENT